MLTDCSEYAHPRVFISYSWEPEKHRELVLNLANDLRRDGIDCRIDQFEQNPIRGWPAWMLDQIDWAGHVLLVCSESYYRAFRQQQDSKVPQGRGIAWETQYIVQKIYELKGQTTKFIPISFAPEDKKSFPGINGSVYRLYEKDGYKNLWRYLAKRPSVIPEQLGQPELPPLDKKERTEDFNHQYSRQMAIVKGWAEILGCKNPDRRVDVIFVHGIAGDLYSAWQPQDEDANGFWLQWLGEEMPGAGIWSLSYEVQSVRWQGSVAPLAPVTNKLLGDLIDLGIGQRPIIFISHDLGSFIVKEILQNSFKSTDTERKNLWKRTQGVAFLSSPCSIQIDPIMDWIDFVVQKLEINFEKYSNRISLSNFFSRLNTDFWDSCRDKKEFKVLSCYPNQPLDNKQIVDSEAEALELQEIFDFVDSVDILNTNHSSICKPRLREEQIYREIKRFILGQSLNRMSKLDSGFRIRNSKGGEPYLLNKSPAENEYNASEPSHNIDNHEIVLAWKTVHFLSEVLYAGFLEFRDEIIRWKEASDASREEMFSHKKVKDYINKKIRESTKNAWRRMNDTVLYKVKSELSPVINSGSLNSISESEYVKFLYNFSDCCEAVNEVIGLDSEKAYEVTVILTKWLYGSLHTADQILKQAFDRGVLKKENLNQE